MNTNSKALTRFIPLTIIIILCTVLTAVNFYTHNNHLAVIIFFTAGLYTILLAELTTIENFYSADHIQTGETPLLVLCMTIGLLFYNEALALVIISLYITAFLYSYLLTLIPFQRKTGTFIYSLFVIMLTCSVIYYLASLRYSSLKKITSSVLTGYIHTLPIPVSFIIIILAVFPVLLFLLEKTRWHTRLYSQGHYFYKATGKSFSSLSFTLKAVRSLSMIVVFLFSGILLCCGYYLRNSVGRKKRIESYGLILLYSQIIVLALTFVSSEYIIIGSFIVSYFALFFHDRHRKIIDA